MTALDSYTTETYRPSTRRPNLSTLGLDPLSYWERINTSQWGRYLTDLEFVTIATACELAGKPGAALEVGCEGGRWSVMLEEQGWEMTCTDVDSESVALCRSRLEHGRCLQVSPKDRTFPCANKAVSLLLCMEVFPVVHNDWFVNEAWRVLAEGGVLVGAALNSCSWKGALHRARCRALGRPQWYCRSYSSWRAQMRKAGFEFYQEIGYSWMPFGRGSNSALIPAATTLEKRLGLRSLPTLSPWVTFVVRKPCREK